jgi:hypothetical protein
MLIGPDRSDYWKVMLLEYARPSTPTIRFAFSVFCAASAIVCCVPAVWSAVHTVRVELRVAKRNDAYAKNPPQWACANAAEEDQKAFEASLGVPLEKAIPAGVLSGGFAVAFFVHAVRSMNAFRFSADRRAA